MLEEVQQFLCDDYPDGLKEKMAHGVELTKDDQICWLKLLHKRGWAGVNWPVEYGGTGWSAVQKYIFYRELGKAHTPPILPFGLNMVAPVIYTFGNDEQRARFLPDILASNVWWCQGYSEPGAGSDLVSLRASAVRQGDSYLVNGQKTWITLAQYADWIFCLVRTDPEAAKPQMGISFLLIDMRSPGIDVKPIKTIDGGYEVNDVFFENVEVPTENLIGEENQGWIYAKMLLTHERTSLAGVAESRYALHRLRQLSDNLPAHGGLLSEDESFNRKADGIEIQLDALEFTELRTLASIATGAAPGPESSILKICGVELQQEITELYTEAAGYYAHPVMAHGDNALPPEYGFARRAASRYFNTRKGSIYGGSNEIQRNIIAKAVLCI